jgi:hypothetical protein
MSTKPLFVPLLDNGASDIKKRFMISFDYAFHDRNILRPLPEFSGSHPDRGMNQVANAFLRSECDWWVNIDADIIFSRQDVDHLLSHIGPDGTIGPTGTVFINGIYPKKQEDTPPCLCTFGDVPEPDVNGVAVVRRTGRGFTLMHRSLLERMKEENGGPALRLHHHDGGPTGPVFTGWNFYQSGPVTGEFSAFGDQRDAQGPRREWISEDWMFCERARAIAVPTLVDTRIALGHEGGKIYRFAPDQVTRFDSDIKTWRDIHGWFDYEDFYRFLVSQIPTGGRFVEVGCWLGRSLAAFATFAREAGKIIELHAVDTFTGAPANTAQATILAAHGGSTARAFRANLAALGIEAIIHEADSLTAAKRNFSPRSIAAVFIDGDHRYEAVRADIQAWIGKVIPGGIIAGHDIDEPGVAQAVAEMFANYNKAGRCWWVRL